MTQSSGKGCTCDNSLIWVTTPTEKRVHVTIHSRALTGYDHPVDLDFVTLADFQEFVANGLTPPA